MKADYLLLLFLFQWWIVEKQRLVCIHKAKKSSDLSSRQDLFLQDKEKINMSWIRTALSSNRF